MFLLLRPSEEDVRAFLDEQRSRDLSYDEVGYTRRQPPALYNIDHNRVGIGSGRESFARAVEAFRNWRMFDLGWCYVSPSATPVEAGETVCVVVRHLGFWSLNASRIVYVLDDDDGRVRRYGFAYGTLPSHAERGEERFAVEWDRTDDSVTYDLFSFSRPGHPATIVGYPICRLLQKRFIRGSQRAMIRYTSTGGPA